MWMPARTRRHIPSALLATLLDILTTNRGGIELVKTHVASLRKPRQLFHYYSDLNYCQRVFYGIRSSTRSKSDWCYVSPTLSFLFWSSITRECNTHIQMRQVGSAQKKTVWEYNYDWVDDWGLALQNDGPRQSIDSFWEFSGMWVVNFDKWHSY